MRSFLSGLVCFIVTAAILTGLIILSALIPEPVIRPQILTSARYLSEGGNYDYRIDGVFSTRIDRYADAITLGIAYQFNGNDPIRSVTEAGYYTVPGQPESSNLLGAVEEKLPANQQYLRYWHGSAGIVRALLTVLTLPQIYLWHRILFFAAALLLVLRLLRRKAYAPAAGFAAALTAIGCWFIPESLEYTWVFLILLAQLHFILTPAFPKNWHRRGLFFLASGMVTNYLDFLSCETVSLLVPLLFLLWQDRKSPGWKKLLRVCVYWAAGYGGMYLLKWLMAGLVLGENPLPYVTGHVEERLLGSVEDSNAFALMISALRRNVLCLFPMNHGFGGGLAAAALAVTAAYVGYVHHRKGFDRQRVLAYAGIGLMPYLRYLMLANHSYLHAFFTYRAQAATLLATVLILAELTGWGESRLGSS